MKSKDKKNLRDEISEEEELELEEYEEESAADNFLQKYRNYIIGGSVVIIAVVALFIWWESTGVENSEAASLAFSRIMPVYTQGQYELALNGDPQMKVRGEDVIGLLKICKEYGSTEQGKLAAFYAGNCYLETGKTNEAEEYFDMALGSDSKLIQAGSYAALGTIAELKGNLDEAASDYEQAANLSIESNGKARYQYYAALIYEKSGKKDKAIEIYKDLVGFDIYSDFTGLAKAGLARLGTIIE